MWMGFNVFPDRIDWGLHFDSIYFFHNPNAGFVKLDFKINLVPVFKLIKKLIKSKPKRPVSNDEIFKKL